MKDKTNSTPDGSSIEKAIKISSVSEEYKYVKRICPSCLNLIEQRLTIENEKPYDVLVFEKTNGEEISFYFDISSFFGK